MLSLVPVPASAGVELGTAQPQLVLITPGYQVSPVKYASETTELLGRVLDHDDSVNDRAEGTKLSNSSAETSKLWSLGSQVMLK